MRKLSIVLLVLFLFGCSEPTQIVIDNQFSEVEILQYQLGDIVTIYMQNTNLPVIKQFTFTVNGIQTTYTGAFGNSSSVILARVNKKNCLCYISIDDIIFYP
ncbi:unnamed protein product [marine sediment metagenome]|uniref:Uncharacterized protein n=1 Tax=marine sediment metagenome TaxID=412755 RepID=X1AU48_9ZZZZ